MSGERECVLVAGGAGYIGSHSTIEVINAGYDAVVIDNLCNSSIGFENGYKTTTGHADCKTIECIERVEQIVGKKIPFYQVDLLDKEALKDIFKKHKIDHVMHFAGLKAVGESCLKPLMYYKNNIAGTMALLEVMEECGVHNIIFSSSATVYGIPQYLPIDEKHPVGACTNPYGKTKYFIEEILSDICASNKKWNVVLLRYFNPVGSHKSGRIGEDPRGPPNNLMPFVSQVAVGRRDQLSVYGTDYETSDGTGVRDYIHVVDLATGHVAALNKLKENCGRKVYNLGTGTGYSVLEMITAFEKSSGKKVPYKQCDRRQGDIASCYADTKLAEKELNWKAQRGLNEMCEDLWRWQEMNPNGFQKEGTV